MLSLDDFLKGDTGLITDLEVRVERVAAGKSERNDMYQVNTAPAAGANMKTNINTNTNHLVYDTSGVERMIYTGIPTANTTTTNTATNSNTANASAIAKVESSPRPNITPLHFKEVNTFSADTLSYPISTAFTVGCKGINSSNKYNSNRYGRYSNGDNRSNDNDNDNNSNINDDGNGDIYGNINSNGNKSGIINCSGGSIFSFKNNESPTGARYCRGTGKFLKGKIVPTHTAVAAAAAGDGSGSGGCVAVSGNSNGSVPSSFSNSNSNSNSNSAFSVDVTNTAPCTFITTEEDKKIGLTAVTTPGVSTFISIPTSSSMIYSERKEKGMKFVTLNSPDFGPCHPASQGPSESESPSEQKVLKILKWSSYLCVLLICYWNLIYYLTCLS